MNVELKFMYKDIQIYSTFNSANYLDISKIHTIKLNIYEINKINIKDIKCEFNYDAVLLNIGGHNYCKN